MLDNQNLNDLASKLADVIPDGIKTLKQDIEQNIRAVLESNLRQMNLVSREEFDVQTALLERTQQKLVQLEQQLEELKSQQEPDSQA